MTTAIRSAIAAAVATASICAFGGTDVVYQRKTGEGVVILTNVPAEEGFSAVAGGAQAPAAGVPNQAAAAPGSVAGVQPVSAIPALPQKSEDAKTAEAFAKQLDQTAPVREGTTNTMRERMESLYEASRAAREAKMRAAVPR